MTLNEQWMHRLKEAVPGGISIATNMFVDHAANAELWDIDGRKFIDFAGGIGVLNTGHRHGKVMQAVDEQLKRYTHTSFQVVAYTPYVELAEKLNQLTPGKFAKKTLLVSTGAEAVENSIKIARMATKRSCVITFSGAFHGRTMFAASLTGKVNPYKLGLGLVTRDIFRLPFPKAGVPFDKTKEALESLFKNDIEPTQVAAIIFEPVQGEGGFYQISPQALAWLRDVCNQHGIVLIADEIQSGFARTGKLFAMEHYAEVEADIMLTAKSLAGGFPLAAVTGRKEIMDAPLRGTLGGTYAGNPVAISAALAVIDVMQAERLPERAEVLGARLEAMVHSIKDQLPDLQEFRRLGAMAAVEFVDATTQAPKPEMAQAVQKYALEHGLILLTCGSYGNVIRFLMPITIEEHLFEQALTIIHDALLYSAK